jgi:hyaluronate lyase
MEKSGTNLKKLAAFCIVICISACLQAQAGNDSGQFIMADTLKPHEQIERKFYDFLTGGSSLDTKDPDVAAKLEEINNSAKTYWNSMEKAPDRTCIWSSLPMVFADGASPFVSSYEMTNTFLRLSAMCQAYRTRGGELYGNKDLGKDILDAAIWMNDNKYKPDKSTFGNWWDWQIGSPLRFIDCIILMKDEMTQNQYQKCVDALLSHVPARAPNAGDANSMWNLFIRLMVGTLSRDDAYIKSVIDGTDDNWFKYAAFRDGFYADGSYIMHGAYPYTGSYGVSAIESLAKLMYLVNGTIYDINSAGKAQAVKWIKESYAPVIYNGLMMDMVRGRAMSRETEGDHSIGHVVVRSIYLITRTIPENEARQLQELIKYWVNTATHRSIYCGEDVTNNNNYVFFINKLKQLMNDTSIPAADKPVFHKQFAAMARIVHSRPEFTFAVSMHSDKINNYELFNGESLKCWHVADGMTYLYNSDMGQYSDDYWPAVDSYRLPGTTVNQNSTVPGNKPNGDSWAGGTSIDGLYGIAGMCLKPNGQTLVAKKSWFMFDDEIVALGSGICASDSKATETIIENRKLKPDNANIFTVDGNMKSASAKTSIFSNPEWMHLSGNSPKSDIGYYFPDASDVRLARGERSGNWREVNSGVLLSRDRALKANYLTLYFNHGNNPVNASYSYVILPDKSPGQVRRYSEKPDITILENSSGAHGVYERKLRITGVNFWNDEVKTVGMVTSDRKSSVIVKETGTELFVSVSEPTKRNGIMNIQLDFNAAECLVKDNNITVVQLSPIVISVDVTGKKGIPSYISFKKGASTGAVPSTGIMLNKSEIKMGMLDDITLVAVVKPSSASQFVAWLSSNTDVVEVSSGMLTPKKAGSAVITAITPDGSNKTSCEVTVTSSNLAIDKPVTENNASSKHPGEAPYPARYAVDGIDDYTNRWAADRNSSEDWLQIDLQKSCDIEGVKISWTNSYAKKFLLQISDDSSSGNWMAVHAETDGQGGYQKIRFDKIYNARYFRLHVASKSDRIYPQYGTSIQEIEVYGK